MKIISVIHILIYIIDSLEYLFVSDLSILAFLFEIMFLLAIHLYYLYYKILFLNNKNYFI